MPLVLFPETVVEGLQHVRHVLNGVVRGAQVFLAKAGLFIVLLLLAFVLLVALFPVFLLVAVLLALFIFLLAENLLRNGVGCMPSCGPDQIQGVVAEGGLKHGRVVLEHRPCRFEELPLLLRVCPACFAVLAGRLTKADRRTVCPGCFRSVLQRPDHFGAILVPTWTVCPLPAQQLPDLPRLFGPRAVRGQALFRHRGQALALLAELRDAAQRGAPGLVPAQPRQRVRRLEGHLCQRALHVLRGAAARRGRRHGGPVELRR
mmetsp:Transcript_37894/g.105445  ORF Transcript_37894/g.105445 Transcript_37894/m.105445 type:complete len:261 (-) Transcript_37894:46-828(-)